MPCYDAQSAQFDKDQGRELRDALANNHKYVDMLCRVLTIVEDDLAEMAILPEDIQAWWREHKAWDKPRKEVK